MGDTFFTSIPCIDIKKDKNIAAIALFIY